MRTGYGAGAASPSTHREVDARRLGVRVARIVLRGVQEVHEVPLDHPGLGRGWWAIERDGTALSRWTDGDATLPLPLMQGNLMLEVHFAGTMSYLMEPEPAAEGERYAADVFVDCTGFAGLLIEKALHTPYVSFAENLFNDAAVALHVRAIPNGAA